MRSIISSRFLLKNDTAAYLYETYAEDMPIIDYHCHLDPKMISENHRFKNLTELLLSEDHYKWRLMRSYGIEEKYITGDGDDREKFIKYAEALAASPGNPLYHWTALELMRYFKIDDALTKENAGEIYDRTLPLFEKEEYTARGFILRSNVKTICTIDDPLDSLEYHKALKKEGFPVQVLPAFRPDKAVNIYKDTFLPYIKKAQIMSYRQLIGWLWDRMNFFEMSGCRMSDFDLEFVPHYVSGISPASVFEKALKGEELTDDEKNAYMYDLMLFFGEENAKRNWAMQLHIGAMRNNGSTMYRELGPDRGFDAMGAPSVSYPLSRYFDALEKKGALPKTIVYSLNPNDFYNLGALIGCFQKGPVRGKMQLGAAWWFSDNKDGIENHIKALSNLGVLGTFIGMLTDSRSFVSYPRHEYFRRILCSILGTWAESGEYPKDYKALGAIIQDICYNNAEKYFMF